MAVYNTGSVTVKVGSASVSGSGTAFNTYISAGNIFKLVSGTAWYEVATVSNATQFTLTSRYADTNYQTSRTSEHVASTNVGTLLYTGTLANYPVIRSSVTITASNVTFTDDGGGTLTGTPTGSGTVDYDTGAVTFTFTATFDASQNISASYFSGDTLSGMTYQIVTDYTTNYSFPEMGLNDINFPYIYTKAVRLIDSAIYNASINTATIASADINGGTIDNTTIGQTTATIANFTSINASTINASHFTNGIVYENLIDNPFEVMSNLDSAGGFGTATYDNRTVATSFTIGEVVTATPSGATGVVVSEDESASTLTIGRAAGRFHDDDEIEGGTSGATADINMPDSAAGVDEVQNGDFSADTDPPPGWSAAAGAVLTTDAGGAVGNALTITCNGSDNPYASQTTPSLTAGELYKFTFYVKQGTEATFRAYVRDGDGATTHGTYTANTEATRAWVEHSFVFRNITTGTGLIILQQRATAGAGTTILFDEVSLWHLRPCSTGTGSFDSWIKSNSLDVYRVNTNDVTLQDGCLYGAMLVTTTSSNTKLRYNHAVKSKDWYLEKFKGRTVTFGMWVKTDTASQNRLTIDDGVTTSNSSDHTGGNDWEWLEVTHIFSASATEATFYLANDGLEIISYICQPMLAICDGLGEGNFSYPHGRIVWLEKGLTSNTITGSGSGDVGTTTLNLDADLNGAIPNGVKSIHAYGVVNDSGSAGTDCYLVLAEDRSDSAYGVTLSPYGLANDTSARGNGWIPCNTNGDIEYAIEATGANTFDITNFRWTGVQLR